MLSLLRLFAYACVALQMQLWVIVGLGVLPSLRVRRQAAIAHWPIHRARLERASLYRRRISTYMALIFIHHNFSSIPPTRPMGGHKILDFLCRLSGFESILTEADNKGFDLIKVIGSLPVCILVLHLEFMGSADNQVYILPAIGFLRQAILGIANVIGDIGYDLM
jgi:hypothetical protein